MNEIIVYNIGTGNYTLGIKLIFIITLIIFGIFWIAVIYDHFIKHNRIKYRMPVVTGIFFVAIFLSIVIPYWTTKRNCYDFDKISIQKDSIILSHSFLNRTLTINKKDIKKCYVILSQQKDKYKYDTLYAYQLVIKLNDNRTFYSELDKKKHLNDIAERINKLLL